MSERSERSERRGSRGREIIGTLLDRGLLQAELYRKRGRSRRVQYGVEGMTSVMSEEEGWAVRAGDRSSSFFAAGTGEPRPEGPWPSPAGASLRLPEPCPVATWKPPPEIGAPLVGETEVFSMFDSLADSLSSEIPGASLFRGVLHDGASEVEILNSRGLGASFRTRTAELRLDAVLGDEPEASTSLFLAAREARHFNPAALARRLADRLVILQRGRAPARDRGEILLAPEVATRLLHGLVPLLCGESARRRLERLRDRSDRIGSTRLTVADDGRYPGGALSVPVDGEGVPTRKVVLIEQGQLRQPLLPWWEHDPSTGLAAGCRHRDGWRAPPRTGPSHLYIEPDPGVPVASLLSGIARGYYFIDAPTGGHFDLEAGLFCLPVCGFSLQGGQSTGPVAGAWLVGAVSSLLQGVQQVARDLSFFPFDSGMIGSPSLLVTGLEIRDTPV